MAPLLRARSGLVELLGIVALYSAYEGIRGFGSATLETARAHTGSIVSLEQACGVFVERGIQGAVAGVPVLPALLGLAYMSLHFGATGAMLLWLHRRHRDLFGLVRTTLVTTTALSLAIYVTWPAAPPRLAGLGFSDTVTQQAHLNLNSDALGALYNPFAAVPSLHFGYSLLVGVLVAVLARGRWIRAVGALYPAFMLFTIVATGNHFLFDAAAGGVVLGLGFLLARAALRVNRLPDFGGVRVPRPWSPWLPRPRCS